MLPTGVLVSSSRRCLPVSPSIVDRTWQQLRHSQPLQRPLFQCHTWRYLYCSAGSLSTDKTKLGHVSVANNGSQSSIAEATPLTFKEKARENCRSAGYSVVIVCGVAVTGYLFYTVAGELFGASSAQRMAAHVQRRCLHDARVLDALGRPVIVRGDVAASGGRRRQQHVAHTEYETDSGERWHRLRFQLEGSRNKATVHADMTKNKDSSYDYRFLFVEVDNFSNQVLVLEDNRSSMAVKKQLPPLPPLS